MSKSTFDAAILSLALDREAGEPLHVQLAAQLRHLILDGEIVSGAKLPSSRTLAEELSVSRVTIVTAMEQLISEGYADAKRGSGLYVAGDLPEHVLQTRRSETAGISKDAPSLPPPSPVRPFQVSAPDMSLFPHREWSRLLERAWRDPSPGLMANADPLGWAPLRTAIAHHLQVWRGIACAPQNVVITSGAADAIDVLAQTAFQPGDVVLLEEPGYRVLAQALVRNRVDCCSIPIDDQGFDIECAVTEHPKARGIATTPSRQFPLGVTLPLSRRLEMLYWAKRTGGIIIEDDFDSEYRYQGQPLPALMSLDDSNSVVYMGSFSKVLTSTLRLGFLVVPTSMLQAITAVKADSGARASLIAQPALAQFMTDGSFAAHIRRTRRIYAKRQAAMVAGIRSKLGVLLHVEPAPAGMHLIADFLPILADRMSDVEAARRADANGVTVQPLSSYYSSQPHREGLVLGYAGYDETQINSSLDALREALDRL